MATISADIYFDSVNGDDANDGSTPALAKESITYFSNSNNHLVNAGVTIYLANGSEWNVQDSETFLIFRGRGTASSPIAVTNYTPSTGAIALPKLSSYVDVASGDWVDAGSGLWTYTMPSSSINFASNYIAIIYGTDPDLTQLASWAQREAALSLNNYTWSGTTLTVNSGGSNPTVTHGRVRLCAYPVFRQFSDSFNTKDGIVYSNIECEYAQTMVENYLTTSTNTQTPSEVHHCTISKVAFPVITKAAYSADGVATCHYHHNTVTLCGYNGIYIDGEFANNCHVYNNHVTYTCLYSTANGGITINGYDSLGTSQGNKVYDNYIANIPHGRTGPYDGAGIYLEAGAKGNKVYANEVVNCHHAVQDNTGESNKIYGNKLHDCGLAFVQSDAGDTGGSRGNVSIEFMNNVCYNMNPDAYEQEPSGTITSPVTCAISLQTDGTYDVRNNIITSATGTDQDGVRINTGATQTVTIENNIFNVTGDDVVNTSRVAQAVDASNHQDTDPLLINGIPSSSSPCYHAGKVISFSMKDFNGHKFNVPPTIGAYEFTSGSEAKARTNR